MGRRMRRLLRLVLVAGCSSPAPPPPKPVPVASASPAPKPIAKSEATPAEPTTPPYDLDADTRTRLENAKTDVAGRVQSKIVSDVFVVAGVAPSYGPSVLLFESAMTGYMNGRFSKKPEHAISVYLFPDAPSYEAFCKRKYKAPCIADFGFYEPNDRYMVMNIGRGIGTLTHEIVHPLVEADFPGAPTWLNEGIASVFEQPIVPKAGEIHGGKNWRLPRLRRGLTSEHVRLDQMFSMSDEAFRSDNEDLHYATARYVCQWLDERGKLWPFFQKWRDEKDKDPTGEKSFQAIVGMTPAEANAPWTKWVNAL